MTDLVEKLRAMADYLPGSKRAFTDAADEIERLRSQLFKAKELLKPFAMLAEIDAKGKDGLESVYSMVAAGRLHDARRFLSNTDEER